VIAAGGGFQDVRDIVGHLCKPLQELSQDAFRSPLGGRK
jgi:hypothetical protein